MLSNDLNELDNLYVLDCYCTLSNTCVSIYARMCGRCIQVLFFLGLFDFLWGLVLERH